jgi:hypothetical protein
MFFSKNSQMLNKMGFISDQKGIINRYLREGEGWNSHLRNSKGFIIDCLKDREGDPITILGSGWLLDVPLEFLKEHSSKVRLVDICHPREIVHKISKYSNFELITADITGGAVKAVYKLIEDFKKDKVKASLSELEFDGFGVEPDEGFIISLNILNQLDILIIDYIRRFNIYSEDELYDFRKLIQQKHVESLSGFSSCIIADYEEVVFTSRSEIDRCTPLIYTELPEGRNRKYWSWNFDNSMTYHKNRMTTLNVMAIEL